MLYSSNIICCYLLVKQKWHWCNAFILDYLYDMYVSKHKEYTYKRNLATLALELAII